MGDVCVGKKITTEWLTPSEYAARRGVSPSRITRLKDKGRLDGAIRQVGKKWQINPDAADKLLASSIDPGQPARKLHDPEPKTPEVEEMSYARARLLEMMARASLKQLEVDEKKGLLVNAEEVRKAAFDCARLTRNKIEAIPEQLGAILAAESDPMRVQEILTQYIKEALTELSSEIQA